MKIRILIDGKTETLKFENAEDFNNFREQLYECMSDIENIKYAKYYDDGVEKIYPSLLIKKSIIEVIEKEPEQFVF